MFELGVNLRRRYIETLKFVGSNYLKSDVSLHSLPRQLGNLKLSEIVREKNLFPTILHSISQSCEVAKNPNDLKIVFLELLKI